MYKVFRTPLIYQLLGSDDYYEISVIQEIILNGRFDFTFGLGIANDYYGHSPVLHIVSAVFLQIVPQFSVFIFAKFLFPFICYLLMYSLNRLIISDLVSFWFSNDDIKNKSQFVDLNMFFCVSSFHFLVLHFSRRMVGDIVLLFITFLIIHQICQKKHNRKINSRFIIVLICLILLINFSHHLSFYYFLAFSSIILLYWIIIFRKEFKSFVPSLKEFWSNNHVILKFIGLGSLFLVIVLLFLIIRFNLFIPVLETDINRIFDIVGIIIDPDNSGKFIPALYGYSIFHFLIIVIAFTAELIIFIFGIKDMRSPSYRFFGYFSFFLHCISIPFAITVYSFFTFSIPTLIIIPLAIIYTNGLRNLIIFLKTYKFEKNRLNHLFNSKSSNIIYPIIFLLILTTNMYFVFSARSIGTDSKDYLTSEDLRLLNQNYIDLGSWIQDNIDHENLNIISTKNVQRILVSKFLINVSIDWRIFNNSNLLPNYIERYSIFIFDKNIIHYPSSTYFTKVLNHSYDGFVQSIYVEILYENTDITVFGVV